MTTEQTKCPLLRVGEIAEQTGKSPRAIRFYEEKGLLLPQSRSDSGYRLYDSDAIDRIQWIEEMQQLGLSIKEIASVLSGLQENQSGPDLMASLRCFYDERLKKTHDEIKRLQNVAHQLENSLRYLEQCGTCSVEHEPSQCRSCGERESLNQMPLMVAGVVNR